MYKDSVLSSHRTWLASISETSRLVSAVKGIVAVYNEGHISTLCWQNAEILVLNLTVLIVISRLQRVMSYTFLWPEGVTKLLQCLMRVRTRTYLREYKHRVGLKEACCSVRYLIIFRVKSVQKRILEPCCRLFISVFKLVLTAANLVCISAVMWWRRYYCFSFFNWPCVGCWNPTK